MNHKFLLFTLFFLISGCAFQSEVDKHNMMVANSITEISRQYEQRIQNLENTILVMKSSIDSLQYKAESAEITANEASSKIKSLIIDSGTGVTITPGPITFNPNRINRN